MNDADYLVDLLGKSREALQPTATDIAIERGDELARCAAEFMDAINSWDKAVEDGDDITEAADKRSNAWLGLRNAIGDYTRASERAKR